MSLPPAARPDDDPVVAVCDTGASAYPDREPFDPPEAYPELPSPDGALKATNSVYAGVRETLRLLGLDAGRYGGASWNPLGEIIRPGDRVVIKPNLVRHFHGNGGRLDALVTHGSVVRAVLDYALLALGNRGEVTLGDSPLQYADFASTLRACGLVGVIERTRRHAAVPIRVVDFRRERSEKRDGMIVARVPNDGDPGGYKIVDLQSSSRFAGLPADRMRRFRVTQYDPRTMQRAHGESTHAYLLPASVLGADVVINLPKLKTHRKVAITAAMKNLVGINGSKDWLPHHTAGCVASGGDEYLQRSLRKAVISALRDRLEGRRNPLARRAIRIVERAVKATGHVTAFPDPYWEGSWHGNDTLWRMVHDLHRALFFADSSGALRAEPQRRCLTIVDAVVAGEGEGPMRPAPRPTGLLVAGANPLAVDTVCCRLMGFDERRIPLLFNAINNGFHPPLAAPERIRIATNAPAWERLFDLPRSQTLRFAPPAGWAGVVELKA